MLRAAARVREAYLALQRAELLAPVDGYVAKRSVQLGQRVQAGRAADVGDRAEPGLGRRQLQGKPAAQPAHRPAGRARRPTSTARRSSTTARSTAWAPAPARPSRCCRRRTRPATGSRWCSACRCASRSTPKELAEHPLRVGLSMDAKVDVQQDRRPHAGRRLARPARAQTSVFDAGQRRGRRRGAQDHRRQSRPAASSSSHAAHAARADADGDGVVAASLAALPLDAAEVIGDARRRRMSSAAATSTAPPAPARRRARRGAARGIPAAAAARELVLGTIALSLATFMNVLDTSIANVSIPAICRRPGRQPDAGHLGHHLVRGRQRDLGAADRLAHAALRPGAPVHGQRAAVRDRVVAVRPGAEHRHADRVPRAAGPRRRADDPAVADAAAGELPARRRPARRWRCGR